MPARLGKHGKRWKHFPEIFRLKLITHNSTTNWGKTGLGFAEKSNNNLNMYNNNEMRKRILILITLIIPVICVAHVSWLAEQTNCNPGKYDAGPCIGPVDVKSSRLFGYGISFSSLDVPEFRVSNYQYDYSSV